MSINWNSVGAAASAITTNLSSALTAAGVTPATISTLMPSLMQQIGAASNPNQADELNVCAQLIQFAGTPMEPMLVQKLVTEQGIPATAAKVAMELILPGVDVDAKVLQIEQLIRQGG